MTIKARISVQKKVLYDALKKATRTRVEPGECKALDIPFAFTGFVFWMRGHREMAISTTDRSLYTDITIPLAKRRGKFKDFALPAYELPYILRRIDDQVIDIDLHEQHAVFRHSFGTFTLSFIKDGVEKFFHERASMILQRQTSYCMIFQASDFHSMIDRLNPYTDCGALRYALCGINIHRSGGKVHFVASDGYNLLRITKDDTENTLPHSILMPNKVISILRRILPRTGSLLLEYYIYQEGDHVKPKYMIETDSVSFYFSPTEGKYPDFNKVIPQSSPHTFRVERMDLFRALDRMGIIAQNRKMRAYVKEGHISLHADDDDFSVEAIEKIPVEHSSKPFRFAFDAGNVCQVLNSFRCKHVNFEVGELDRAIVVKPDKQPEGEHITAIFMPCLRKEDFDQLYKTGILKQE